MARTVWVVSELYHPEQTSTGYFLAGIAEGLAQHYQVRVLCAQPTYSARGTRAPRYEERNGVRIRRCLTSTFDKEKLVLRLINLATISISISFNAIWRLRTDDCVIVVTNPPLLPFLVAFAARLRGARCLLLVHDVYPEVLVAAGMIKAESRLARIIDRLSRTLYRNVERIIVLGRDMEQLIRRKIDADRDQIVIIPNWADVDEVLPGQRSQSKLLRTLGLSDRFVVQYSGNMGRTHGLGCLLKAAEKLSGGSDTHFLFVGSGAKKRWLEETARAKGLSNVTIIPSCPRADLPSYLNACDVAIISFVPGMAGISVPSRMYNVLAAGKPIIAVADSDSELAQVVQEEQVGWVVPPDDPDRVLGAILEARNHPDLLRKMGLRARMAAENRFSPKELIGFYVTLIASLD